MFLKSDNPKKCNMWVGVKDPADGIYKGRHTGTEAFDGYGQYYDGYDYSIVNLGSFAPGTEIEIRLTILQQDKTGNNEYVMVKDFQFYHLDYNAFHEDIEQLKQSPWNLDLSKTKDDYLVGEVDAKAGQILYTSIPYEPGWTIKVDGKKVEERFDDIINDAGTSVMVNDTDGKDGEVVILNALIGLRLPEGHHTVSMKYSPPGFRTGCVFLVFGIAAIVLLFIYDRKNNMIMIQERELAEMRKKGITPPAEDKSVPVAQIIKSKGAITEKPLKQEKQEDSDDDEKPEEAPDEVSEAVDETVDAAEKPQKENTSKPQPKNNNRPKNGGNKKKKKK